jgi:hypothetical protein
MLLQMRQGSRRRENVRYDAMTWPSQQPNKSPTTIGAQTSSSAIWSLLAIWFLATQLGRTLLACKMGGPSHWV